MNRPALTVDKADRRLDIDWLRIGATYLLFFFHTAKVFDTQPFYHIKNSLLSERLNMFTGFIHLWHMPLFFLLAGWSLFASMESRGALPMLKERALRLLVPFVLGTIFMCPVIQYFTAIGMLGFSGSFIDFIPHFFTSMKYFSWSHLWFILYLFAFTAVYAPLFVFLLRKRLTGNKLVSAHVYLPALLFAVIQATLRIQWPGWQNLYNDWANVCYYSSFFILGFVLHAVPRSEELVHGQTVPALALAIAASLVLGFTPVWTLRRLGWAVSGLAGYFWVLAILGLGNRFLAAVRRYHGYFAQSSLPVYILHQFFIVVSGAYVLTLAAHPAVKYFIILAASIILTMMTYHLIICRINPLRFAFGMKAADKSHFTNK